MWCLVGERDSCRVDIKDYFVDEQFSDGDSFDFDVRVEDRVWLCHL